MDWRIGKVSFCFIFSKYVEVLTGPKFQNYTAETRLKYQKNKKNNAVLENCSWDECNRNIYFIFLETGKISNSCPKNVKEKSRLAKRFFFRKKD